ncbi:MAG: response regulator, partial [Bacillota bacterium]
MKTILIAEDDVIVRNNLEEILSQNDFIIFTAENGYDCFFKAKQVYPDLIISDIRMPEMDGMELLSKIRNDRVLSNLPFVFLTAKSAYEDFRYGMVMGADDYLVKPVSVTDLLDSVNSVLEKHEKHKKKMDDLRDRIALTVPHEFRTPLTAILGYSEILQDEIQYFMENDEIHYIINNLSVSAKRFNNLVKKFTNYTNASLLLNDPESVKNISSRNISSPKMIIQMNALKAAEKHKRLEDLEMDLADVKISYDEFYLSYMVEELVDNAMKYSVSGSKIIVRSFVDGNDFVISILDF